MESAHLHRVHLIAAAANVSMINSFIKTSIDPTGGDWLALNLSPTGELPFTHAQCSAAMTQEQHDLLKTFLLKFPTGKEGEAGMMLSVVVDDNHGEWTDPNETLDQLGLNPPIPPEAPPAAGRSKR